MRAKRMIFKKVQMIFCLSKYTPPGVIVNEYLDIVQFRGSTGDFPGTGTRQGKPEYP